MPATPSFSDWPCSIARASEVLSDPWAILVVRDVFRGVHRFDDFRRSLSIPTTTLTGRIRALVDAGVIEARPYQENPVRYEYHFTPKGRDLFPVLRAIAFWGDRWEADDGGVPMKMRHTVCGTEFEIVSDLICPGCTAEYTPETIEYIMGPGNPNEPPANGDLRFSFGRPTRNPNHP